MILSPTFFNQVRLLVATLPQIHKEDCFALKGGTAINLFIRDMPRLSVDIDLAYIPIENRSASLSKIDSALKRIGKSIVRYIHLPLMSKTFNHEHIVNCKLTAYETFLHLFGLVLYAAEMATGLASLRWLQQN